MITDSSKKEVIEFLNKNKNPTVCIVPHMYEGFVTCIKPIQTICGAELHCNPNTEAEVRNLISAQS